jgi:hypothetical protein
MSNMKKYVEPQVELVTLQNDMIQTSGGLVVSPSAVSTVSGANIQTLFN